MKYEVDSTGHNGEGDCQPITIFANSLRSAKAMATREAGGDRCHICIWDDDGQILSRRDARDTYWGCCKGGWLPWQDF